MQRKEKNNVILDLDETIISSKNFSELNDYKNAEYLTKNFKFQKMEDEYLIFERPYLQEFLTWLFTYFNVIIWSAGSKDYVLFIIDKIILKDKKRKLKLILFSDHCKMVPKNTQPKDLDYLLFQNPNLNFLNSNNTVIIDDLDKVYDTNNDNCIAIKPFNVFDPQIKNDKELLNIKDQINYFFDGRK